MQIRVHLPQISAEDIHQLSTDELTNLADIDLTGHFEDDKERIGELYFMCCKPLIRSVRDVKRIFNQLRFSEPATRHEVCFSDMYGLEVIAIKAPTVYELLRAHPGAYTGMSSDTEMILEKPNEYVARYKDDRLGLCLLDSLVRLLRAGEYPQRLFEAGGSGSARACPGRPLRPQCHSV